MRRSKRLFRLGIVIALTCLSCQWSQAPRLWPASPPLPEQDNAQQAFTNVHYAFMDVNVITMETEEILPHQMVVTAGKEILSIGPVGQAPAPATAEQIPARGKYLMPGLADMHVHLQAQDYLLLLLLNGVTTVRNMNGAPAHLQWREQIARGELLGPTLFTTGPIIDEPAWNIPGDRECEKLSGAVCLVAQQKALGYDFIKVYDDLSPGAYQNVLTAAQAYGIDVVGHVPDSVGVLAVLAAGQRSIEHLDGYLDAKAAELTAAITATVEHQVWNCPTLVEFQLLQPLAGPPTTMQQAMITSLPAITTKFWFLPRDFTTRAYGYMPVTEKKRQILAKLYAVHAPLILGTDAPYPYALPGFAVEQELQDLVDAGLTPYAALRTATYNAAQFLRRLDQAGTVSVGKQADLLLLNTNPLENIANVHELIGVMVQGRWLTKEELLGRLNEAEDGGEREARAFVP